MKRQMSILTDVTRCIGCEDCVRACKTTYGLPADRPWRWQKDVADLSATRWTTIINRPGGHHVRKQCRHCLEPACVSVCPVGALSRTPEGAIVYDGSICMGCRYCMMSCPYGIPRYTWLEPVPYVRKCVLCYEKIQAGELDQPACTKACPVEATIYGYREELLAEAHRRIKANPDKYIDHVWGEHEVGGTNVLYISNVDLGFLGWKPERDTEPLPAKTWPALRVVPGVFLGVGAAMTATSWIIGRRMRLAAESAAEAAEAEAAEARAAATETSADEGAQADGHDADDKKGEADSK